MSHTKDDVSRTPCDCFSCRARAASAAGIPPARCIFDGPPPALTDQEALIAFGEAGFAVIVTKTFPPALPGFVVATFDMSDPENPRPFKAKAGATIADALAYIADYHATLASVFDR